jgi:hypothetical protein
LKGQFIVLLDNDQQVLVTKEFVVEHFDQRVIHSVVHAFDHSFQKAPRRDIQLDNVQVVKVRWESFELAGKPDGKRTTNSESEALTSDGRLSGILADGRQIALSQEFVEANVSSGFIGRLKLETEKRKNRSSISKTRCSQTQTVSSQWTDCFLSQVKVQAAWSIQLFVFFICKCLVLFWIGCFCSFCGRDGIQVCL